MLINPTVIATAQEQIVSIIFLNWSFKVSRKIANPLPPIKLNYLGFIRTCVFMAAFLKRKEYSSFVQSDLQLPPNYFGLVSGCVAQFVEWSLQIPEVHGSNPVIGKNIFILNICLMSTVYWKDNNKEKEAGNGPFLKKPISV